MRGVYGCVVSAAVTDGAARAELVAVDGRHAGRPALRAARAPPQSRRARPSQRRLHADELALISRTVHLPAAHTARRGARVRAAAARAAPRRRRH